MLALLDGVLELPGTKTGRGGQQYHVHPAVDRLPVGVQADELPLRRHVDLRGQARGGTPTDFAAGEQPLSAGLQAIREGVGHGPQLHRAGGAQCLHGSPRAATAAPDETDAEAIIGANRLTACGSSSRTCNCSRGRGRAGLADKLAPS